MVALFQPNCLEIISSGYPFTNWDVPWIHTLFENTAAVASGIESAMKVLKRKGRYDADKKAKVVAMAGDGGTADIGFHALSSMMERGHDVLYVCYDNEAYMNTGNQRSGSTPMYSATSTTSVGVKSRGEQSRKKNVPMIFAAHHVPYVGTASVSFPMDLMAKVAYAKDLKGFKMLIINSPCPTGWRYDPSKTVELGRLIVQTGIWPLYEILDGRKFRLSENNHVQN